MIENDLERCFRGEALYGDDFGPDALEQWHRDERDAYYELSASGSKQCEGARAYGYHALNRRHGFSRLPKGRLGPALSIGGAFGDELLPVLDRVDCATIIEPARGFSAGSLHGVSLQYVEPSVTGGMPFDDGAFGLILCFGSLHHIANVSRVVAEMYRCLRPGGFALVREPIVSMGDWRRPRAGLTKRERGIPLDVFDRILAGTGFSVVRRALCMFAPLNAANARMQVAVYASRWLVLLDSVLCRASSWNYRYHRTTVFRKLGPTNVFYVLTKTG